MKDPRTIVVKTLFNADEFVAFSTQCEADDVPQSKKLRDLARSWLAERNRTATQHQPKRPARGHVMAMVLPSRGARPAFYVRN
jgi:hypothetical protein